MDTKLPKDTINAKPFFLKYKTQDEFWRYYIKCVTLHLEHKYQFAERELEVVVYILKNDLDKDQFFGKRRDRLMKELGIKYDNAGMLKTKLKKKGWLEDGLLHAALRNQAKLIKEEGFTKLNIHYSISPHDLN